MYVCAHQHPCSTSHHHACIHCVVPSAVPSTQYNRANLCLLFIMRCTRKCVRVSSVRICFAHMRSGGRMKTSDPNSCTARFVCSANNHIRQSNMDVCYCRCYIYCDWETGERIACVRVPLPLPLDKHDSVRASRCGRWRAQMVHACTRMHIETSSSSSPTSTQSTPESAQFDRSRCLPPGDCML